MRAGRPMTREAQYPEAQALSQKLLAEQEVLEQAQLTSCPEHGRVTRLVKTLKSLRLTRQTHTYSDQQSSLQRIPTIA